MRNTNLVAIVNLTPDSFSDGGQYADGEAALAAIAQLIKDGADVVDIGAESTRPGATPITPPEEWARLEPVLVGLTRFPGAVFSLDTRHGETVKKALAYNIGWINDVSGFAEPLMVEAVKHSDCKLVVMHSLSVPADKNIVLPPDADVVAVLIDWAQARFSALEKAGIARSRLIFDPGIGFGKTPAQSRAILDNIAKFDVLGVPLFVGHSRKSFLGADEAARDAVTLALSKQLAGQVDYLRVHTIIQHRRMLEWKDCQLMSQSVENFLNQLHHPMLASIDLSLNRMTQFLALLGSPHKRLPPVIHVAGTNGKGSLLAYLHAILEAKGLRVHRYTSPHLIHFNERILLNGKPVDNAYLESVLRHVAPFLQQQPVTFFEATTALAFLIFAEKPADILLLETGMGGRLDATNLVEKPLLTAITPVSFDHCEYLGKTLSAIAAEKAGILKRNIPCVVGKQNAEAASAIAQKAAVLSAPLYRYGQEWQVEKNIYRSAQREIALKPSLVGAYQFDNAATAVACIEQLPQLGIENSHIEQGLSSAYWPARLQPLTQGRFAKALPQGVELWLDGGHNPQGGEVLAQWLSEQPGKEIYLICGMGKGKDTPGYLKPLVPHVSALYAIAIPGESTSQSAAQIETAAKQAGMAAFAAPSLENALQTIAENAKTPSIICICGSLYLAGKVLAANQ